MSECMNERESKYPRFSLESHGCQRIPEKEGMLCRRPSRSVEITETASGANCLQGKSSIEKMSTCKWSEYSSLSSKYSKMEQFTPVIEGD